MPELPEVETVMRGLAPYLEGRVLRAAVVRDHRLRWPVPGDLDARIAGRRILALSRRGKYLLMRMDEGALICHLGMSGSLRLLPADTPLRKHDHIDLLLENGQALRYHDPRRFGALLWAADPGRHPLIARLGVEPLSGDFDGACLHTLCRGRASAIKQVIMDAHLVVGVGNIYANEALFHAGIDPRLAAGKLSRPRCERLAAAIKSTLESAIAAGGSTLRDFVDGHGSRGWFQQSYRVYGRAGEVCAVCGGAIRTLRQAARATYFCPACQRR